MSRVLRAPVSSLVHLSAFSGSHISFHCSTFVLHFPVQSCIFCQPNRNSGKVARSRNISLKKHISLSCHSQWFLQKVGVKIVQQTPSPQSGGSADPADPIIAAIAKGLCSLEILWLLEGDDILLISLSAAHLPREGRPWVPGADPGIAKGGTMECEPKTGSGAEPSARSRYSAGSGSKASRSGKVRVFLVCSCAQIVQL